MNIVNAQLEDEPKVEDDGVEELEQDQEQEERHEETRETMVRM